MKGGKGMANKQTRRCTVLAVTKEMYAWESHWWPCPLGGYKDQSWPSKVPAATSKTWASHTVSWTEHTTATRTAGSFLSQTSTKLWCMSAILPQVLNWEKWKCAHMKAGTNGHCSFHWNSQKSRNNLSIHLQMKGHTSNETLVSHKRGQTMVTCLQGGWISTSTCQLMSNKPESTLHHHIYIILEHITLVIVLSESGRRQGSDCLGRDWKRLKTWGVTEKLVMWNVLEIPWAYAPVKADQIIYFIFNFWLFETGMPCVPRAGIKLRSSCLCLPRAGATG
jgi:hypothetical protein